MGFFFFFNCLLHITAESLNQPTSPTLLKTKVLEMFVVLFWPIKSFNFNILKWKTANRGGGAESIPHKLQLNIFLFLPYPK